jgi:hypothetical protein
MPSGGIDRWEYRLHVIRVHASPVLAAKAIHAIRVCGVTGVVDVETRRDGGTHRLVNKAMCSVAAHAAVPVTIDPAAPRPALFRQADLEVTAPCVPLKALERGGHRILPVRR